MKDLERDMLAKLLVYLIKSHDATLSRTDWTWKSHYVIHVSLHILRFEPVLATLEDTVNDAQKAPEFLARLFAKVTAENVVSPKKIG